MNSFAYIRLSFVRWMVLFTAIALVGLLTVDAQESTPEATEVISEGFSGELAYQHIADYIDGGLRVTATLTNITVGNTILDKLDAFGWETSEDWHVINFGDVEESAAQELADWNPVRVDPLLGDIFGQLAAETENWRGVEIDNVMIPIRNLVANYGTTTDGGSTIILGAHYDSRLYADHDEDAENHREPMPGANDGGSGVGVLLELARVLSESYTPNTQIRIVLFDAEDQGRIEPWTSISPGTSGYIVGSTYYANSLDLVNDPISQMILVDLVGEFDQRFPIEGYSNQYFPELSAAIWQTAAELGYEQYFPNEVRGAIIDDHVPFIARNIPSADIIDLDYEYWHTTEDTLDKIDPLALERVGQVLVAYLENIGAITRRAG